MTEEKKAPWLDTPDPQRFIKNAAKFNDLMMMYRCAIREVQTKLEVLDDEFSVEYKRNPISFIKTRIKKPESIYRKLQKLGYDFTAENIQEQLNDVAGVRVVCAFIELFGIEEKDADGNKVDNTTEAAKITNSTSVMLSTVAQDVNAIGYVSLGSLDDSVTALKIDGAEATAENIESGDYKVVRPFNIATKDDVSEAAQDFITYIMSGDGQKIIEDNGYISVGDKPAYEATAVEGKVVVAGSSSVTPVMEKLAEGYKAVNDKVDIEVQQSDSTTGMTSAIDGLCDIGMASRDLKDSETEAGLTATVIAKDGIAVIVNNDSGVEELTSEQVKDVYTGNITTWEDLTK